jgi:Mg/Co/Ni transporter MgtE
MNQNSQSSLGKTTHLLWLAKQPSVVKRALKIAFVVGIVLAAINHGDTLIAGQIGIDELLKIFLTFLVPYCVSTYSSVLAIREKSQFLKPQ